MDSLFANILLIVIGVGIVIIPLMMLIACTLNVLVAVGAIIVHPLGWAVSLYRSCNRLFKPSM